MNGDIMSATEREELLEKECEDLKSMLPSRQQYWSEINIEEKDNTL